MRQPEDHSEGSYPYPRGTCPRCSSGSVAHTLFGMPDPRILESAPDWVVLGGCSISPGITDRECNECGHKWEDPTELDASFPDDKSADDDSDDLDPGILCLLHLANPDEAPTPAETAYLLGNDPDLIREAIAHDREQEALYSADILEERNADDPDEELIEVHLGEARAWAQHAQLKLDALRHILAHEPAQVDFVFDDELAEIRRTESEWLAIHNECDEPWNKTDTCPVHSPAIKAGRQEQRRAVQQLRRRLQTLLAG